MDEAQVTYLARIILYGLIGAYLIHRCYLRRKAGGDKWLAFFLFMAGFPLVFLSATYTLVLLEFIGPNAFMRYTGWVGLVSFSGFYFTIIRARI